jgi:CO dehydrogenase maturation factor
MTYLARVFTEIFFYSDATSSHFSIFPIIAVNIYWGLTLEILYKYFTVVYNTYIIKVQRIFCTYLNLRRSIRYGVRYHMKLAISGKGGVGKTMLSALLAREFERNGYSVLAIDADPDTNLASALGFPDPESITPISEMKDLIEERTGVKPGQPGSLFKLNPKVDDIPEKYAQKLNGIRLMVMGKVKRGGSGCYCSENTLLQALMAHLLVARNEAVILDMAAGIEHLGRATAKAVDELIIVVEPGRKSMETAVRIKNLARDIGLTHIVAAGNKVRGQSDIDYMVSALPGFEFYGFIPFDAAITDAEIANTSSLEASQRVIAEVRNIYEKLVKSRK